ncbi:sulfite exporter TauE/SafE family protein [Ensifer sp. ENS06]|uniref:sulfite exporter TauE/SafE family protein n=1 Tax=Ensifer sp. ENS06 TaxID=2769276 RepID=UPI00177CA408|nr:sulfite exporter TauE/SafE family protein [Ensifer sp. ENS06]MBD9626494.1 sulfite exporter TauE/SafE family protein [Ensifer sp. ENS06]
MSLGLLAVLAAVTFVSAFIQGALGIGFALIVAPIVGMLKPDLLPVTLLLLMLPLNLHVAARERAHVDWSGATWITIGRFAGTFAGLWLLAALSIEQLDLAVGVFTVVAAVTALIAPPFTPNRPSALGVGLFTGVTETATGIGGPPLALLYQHAKAPVLRATVALCFFVGEVMSLVVLAISGRVGSEQLLVALYLTPAVLLGSAVSKHVHGRIGGRGLRIAVLGFAIVSGLFLIVR